MCSCPATKQALEGPEDQMDDHGTARTLEPGGRRGGCPYTGDPFDLADADEAFAPKWLGRARKEAPVFWMPEIKAWVVTRHEDIHALAVDHRTFSSNCMNRFKTFTGELAGAFPDGHPGEHSILKMDAPDHTRVRRLADTAFNRSAADGYVTEIRKLVDGLIDSFIDEGQADLVQDYALKLPLQVILHVSGIPLEHEAHFAQWGGRLLRPPGYRPRTLTGA
jgi:cytochrome P450